MYSTPVWRIILMILLIGATGCATGPESINPYFETPPDRLPITEQELYNKALTQLKNNHPDDSIKLWKRFLEHNPRSFKGYNNLGMAHYSNDQLEKSISAFETALALEPFDLKIKDNLKRSLRFQVTILRENKDYEKSIQLLERVKELTDQPGKEKVALEIEQLQDLIFEQVKRTNTLENYEAFLEKYPDNPIYADEARRQIAKMKPQESPMGKFPEMQDEFISAPGQRPSKSLQESLVSEPFVPDPLTHEPMDSVPAPPPIQKETIEIVAETQKPDEEEEIPLDIQDDPAMEEALDVPAPPEALDVPAPPKAPEAVKVPEAPKQRAMKQPEPMEPLPVPDSDMEMKRETPSMDSQTPKPMPTKRVRIVTRHAPLRVRMEPDALSKVVAQVPKGSIVQVFQEEKGWYQIEYKKGKKGWISKKYSKLIN